MSLEQDTIDRAKAIRQRLMNPPNAKKDSDIDLRRHRRPPPKPEPETESFPQEILIPTVIAKAIVQVHEICQAKKPKRIELYSVLRAVTYKYDIGIGDIKGHHRDAVIVLPRQIAVYLIMKLVTPKLSSTAIGRMIGGRDHATILSSKKKIARLIQSDPKLLSDINEIEDWLNSGMFA